MLIDFACSCGCKLQAQEEHAGTRVTCPDCGRKLFVPSPEAPIQLEPVDQPTRSREEVREETDEDRPRRAARPRPVEESDRPRRTEPARDEEMSPKVSVALLLGAGSFCLNVLAAIPAVILAIVSLGEIRRSGGRLVGKGLAIAALILACVGTVVGGAAYYFGYRHFYPAEDKDKETKDKRNLPDPNPDRGPFGVRESANRMTVSNNFHQMTLAMQFDADSHNGQMMAPAIYSKDGKPLLSWRVTLLPYIEQDVLYNQFHLDEPWDSPNNIQLLSQMPKLYSHPYDPDGAKRGQTCYRVFTGPGTAFPEPMPPFNQFLPFTDRGSVRFPGSFTDGISQSILIAEASETVPWTKPDELPYDPSKPLPKLGGRFQNGFFVGMADGPAHWVSSKVSDATIRAAITIAGNDRLGDDW